MEYLYAILKRRFKTPRTILITITAILLYSILVTNFVYFMLETSFKHFKYPIYHPNFSDIVHSIQQSENSDKNPEQNILRPLYPGEQFRYHFSPKHKCLHNPAKPIDLLIVVKSAIKNSEFRAAIRQTWGNEQQNKNLTLRTVFIIGECSPTESLESTRTCIQTIAQEYSANRDIIQANFYDNYYNNTLKTVSTFEWLYRHCRTIAYILFVDDDYYVSIKNLLLFKNSFMNLTHWNYRDDFYDDYGDNDSGRQFNYDGRFYAGFVYPNSSPKRSWLSKWFISLSDYPYARYPPYITGGIFLMNNRTVRDIYYSSLYTKHFPFDDVYLGILAWKMKIRLIHNAKMTFKKRDPLYDPELISSHDYKQPQTMADIWRRQYGRGLA